MIIAALLVLVLASAAPALHPERMNGQLHSTHFVTTDGVRLHVLEAGGADAGATEAGTTTAGRPVIAFVPGWSMPASIWKKPLAALSLRHRVAALDPRGQGESEIPAEGYTLERRVEDIHEFISRYPKVVLVAWSLGALESLQYLHVHGEAAVSSLVIVDSSVGEAEREEAASAAPASTRPPAGGFQAQLRRDRFAVLDGFVRAMFRTPQAEADIVALRDGALRMPLEASLALFPGNRIPREHWREIAHRLEKPLLYVVTPQFAAQAESLKKNRPGTRVELFESAGHALFVDEPERFSALLAAFVDSQWRLP